VSRAIITYVYHAYDNEKPRASKVVLGVCGGEALGLADKGNQIAHLSIHYDVLGGPKLGDDRGCQTGKLECARRLEPVSGAIISHFKNVEHRLFMLTAQKVERKLTGKTIWGGT
jgi:hypothetical protein